MDYIIGIGIIIILIIVFIGVIIISKTRLKMDKEEIRELVTLSLIIGIIGTLTTIAIIKGITAWN